MVEKFQYWSWWSCCSVSIRLRDRIYLMTFFSNFLFRGGRRFQPSKVRQDKPAHVSTFYPIVFRWTNLICFIINSNCWFLSQPQKVLKSFKLDREPICSRKVYKFCVLMKSEAGTLSTRREGLVKSDRRFYAWTSRDRPKSAPYPRFNKLWSLGKYR